MRAWKKVVLITGLVLAAALPAYASGIEILGDLEITTEETTTLTGVWDISDEAAYFLWFVDDAIVDGDITSGQTGSDTFVFGPAAVGTYEVFFGIWDSATNQSGYQTVTVTVTLPLPVEVHKNHRQCVKATVQNTPSGPGKGKIVSEKAHQKGCSCDTPPPVF
jgi:hypothetical protein